MNRSTLQIHSLIWIILGINRKASYYYPHLNMSVTYRPLEKHYTISAYGKDLFSDVSPSVCLERASKVIMEHYAVQFTPVWEVAA